MKFSITNQVGQPGYSSRYDSKTGKTDITEDKFNPKQTLNLTVVLPSWSGYAKASESEKEVWDTFIQRLSSHEYTHVGMNIREAVAINRELQNALPSKRSYSIQGRADSRAITQGISNRYRAANSVVARAPSRLKAMNVEFDSATNHGRY